MFYLKVLYMAKFNINLVCSALTEGSNNWNINRNKNWLTFPVQGNVLCSSSRSLSKTVPGIKLSDRTHGNTNIPKILCLASRRKVETSNVLQLMFHSSLTG